MAQPPQQQPRPAEPEARTSPGDGPKPVPAAPALPVSVSGGASGGGQSVPPWEALPPEADEGLAPAGAEHEWAPEPLQQEAVAGRDTAAQSPSALRREAFAPSRDEAASVMQPVATSQQPQFQPQPSSHPLVEEPVSDPVAEQWVTTVAELNARGAVAALARELAMQSQGVHFEAGADAIHITLKLDRESLCGDSNRDRLAQALTQQLGKPVTLVLQRGPAVITPARREQQARVARQCQAEALIEGDALVRQLLASFPGAKLVPGSVRPL